jgi:hypothetical protein
MDSTVFVQNCVQIPVQKWSLEIYGSIALTWNKTATVDVEIVLVDVPAMQKTEETHKQKRKLLVLFVSTDRYTLEMCALMCVLPA